MQQLEGLKGECSIGEFKEFRQASTTGDSEGLEPTELPRGVLSWQLRSVQGSVYCVFVCD